MKKKKKGFTLVEIMIVVVIIAILASLIVPRMADQVEKAKVAEGLQMFGTIQSAVESRFERIEKYAVASTKIQTDGSGAYSGNQSGDWSTVGVQGPEKSKNWSYYYQGVDTGTPGYCIQAVTGGTATMIAYCSSIEVAALLGLPSNYYCQGLVTNGGDTSKPCTIK